MFGVGMPEAQILNLQELHEHLQACPSDFLRTESISLPDWLNLVQAVLRDWLALRLPDLHPSEGQYYLQLLRAEPQLAEWTGLLCWIMADKKLSKALYNHPQYLSLLIKLNRLLAELFLPQTILQERGAAEECLRLILQTAGLKIQGETPEQSTVILDSISTARRREYQTARDHSLRRQQAIQEARQRLLAMDQDN